MKERQKNEAIERMKADGRFKEVGHSKEVGTVVNLAESSGLEYPRVIITDSEDNIVFEMINQVVVFPPRDI